VIVQDPLSGTTTY